MPLRKLLTGLRIVENASVITGPFAGGMFAHLGADIIKVEPPNGGDQFRTWGKSGLNIRPSFAAYNRGKRSITLNLKHPQGRDVYLQLIKSADAVIENSRPGVMDKLGVGWSALHELNPTLVYCYITGLGSWGPEAGRPAYDAVAQAMSGLWSQFTDLSSPEALGPNLADQVTGLYAAFALLAGIEQRRETGNGVKLEISMLASCVSFLGSSLSSYLMEGTIPNKSSRPRNSQAFAFLDSEGLAFAVQLSGLEKFWVALCKSVERPDLITDSRFSTKSSRTDNYDELREVLQEIFKTQSRKWWGDLLKRHDVPFSEILSVPDAVTNPQVQALGIISDSGEASERWVKAPIAIDDKYLGSESGAPTLSQHTLEIIRDLGYSDEDAKVLQDDGVISSPTGASF